MTTRTRLKPPLGAFLRIVVVHALHVLPAEGTHAHTKRMRQVPASGTRSQSADMQVRIRFHRTPSPTGRNREGDRHPGGIAARASHRSMIVDRWSVRANPRAHGRSCRVHRGLT